MRISDIPEFKDKSHVLTISKDTKIIDCVKKMSKHNYGSIIIAEKNKPIGIFTERDLLNKVIAKDIDPKKDAVEKVMTKDLATAKSDDQISTTLRRMSQGHFRHMPIVDADGNINGIISQGDLVSYSWSEIFHFLGQKTKSSFMTHTQIWMLIIALGVYGYIAMLMIK